MKNIAFTICSNNYLSQAKILSDSVYEHSRADYDFIIVLCDEFNDKIDYNEFHAEFIEAKYLGISNFEWMTRYYNIIELNTAVKPFAFQKLITQYHPKFIHYLDPDTCTYASLKEIEKELEPNYSILLTPHELAPLPFDGKRPADNTFLNAGIYNLGFLGLKVTVESMKMLNWWSEFLSEHCLIDLSKGFFVDQLPMELVPLFFEGVKICRHKGINVAYWNLHERTIIYNESKGKYTMNDGTPLIMYHFSNFKINQPSVIASYDTRHDLNSMPDINRLFTAYAAAYTNTKISLYKSIKCVYMHRYNKPWRVLVRRASNKLALITRQWADKLARI